MCKLCTELLATAKKKHIAVYKSMGLSSKLTDVD